MSSDVRMEDMYVVSSTPNRLYLGQRIYASGTNVGDADKIFIEVTEDGDFTGNSDIDFDSETRHTDDVVTGLVGFGDFGFDGTAAGRSVNCKFIGHIYSKTQQKNPNDPQHPERTKQRHLRVIGTTPP